MQLDADGNLVEDGLKKDESSISITHIKDEETKKSFMSAKRDDVIKIDIHKTFAADSEIAMVLGVDKEQVEALDPFSIHNQGNYRV